MGSENVKIDGFFRCRYCSNSSTDINGVVGQNCLKSPSGKCEVYDGVGKIDGYFHCKYCSNNSSEYSGIIGSSCCNSPTGCCMPI